jgi:hypothetical protein
VHEMSSSPGRSATDYGWMPSGQQQTVAPDHSGSNSQMSALSPADIPEAPGCWVSTGAISGQIARAGAYLTDEVFLYRVVGTVAGGDREMVELEDAYWLDVVCVPLRDLRARRLRLVTPMHADA